MNGEALADAILSHLKTLNLPLKKTIGLGYDGASSMSGIEKFVQAVGRESCPQAVCVHCSAHTLNSFFVKPEPYLKLKAHSILSGILLVCFNRAVNEMHH